ncbi:hypothetical protein MMC29_003446 [Sticta canariensis]|nr:hypothetical protein [Sticta canariensis]
MLITHNVQSKPTPEPNPQNINLDSLPYESLSFPFEIGLSLNQAEALVPPGTPCYPEHGGTNAKKRQLAPCEDSEAPTKQPQKSIPNPGIQQLQHDPTNNHLPLIDPEKLKLPDLLEEKQDPLEQLRQPLGPLLGGASASGCKQELIPVCGPKIEDDEAIPFMGGTLYDVEKCLYSHLPLPGGLKLECFRNS